MRVYSSGMNPNRNACDDTIDMLDPEPTYGADWTCNGCGRALTLSPGEASCCSRGVTKIAGH